MRIPDTALAAASEQLEPNLQFYREHSGDRSRYFVDPDVTCKIAEVAIRIALPYLLSGVEKVRGRIADWMNGWKKKGQLPTKPPDSLHTELMIAIETTAVPIVTRIQVDDAAAAVSVYLSDKGWPKPFADSDAKQIVSITVEMVRTRKTS